MGRSRSGRSPQRGVALTSVRIIGAGRAGTSFASAWSRVGIDVDLLGRRAPVDQAASGVDAVLVATTDRAIAEVAAAIEPGPAAVLHCSGASGLEVLGAHERRGSIHPLMALPDRETGAARLGGGGWFAVAGDPITYELVDALGGHAFSVADHDRALYHASAVISANHTVVLLGQIERLARRLGVPLEAFLQMAQASLDDVAAQGAPAALTGPAARGDIDTLELHRQALPEHERPLYDALATAAVELAKHDGARHRHV